MDYITIGKAAEEARVNIDTILYYERQGLIPRPHRTASGYRQYDEDTIKKIRFIKRAQKLGFSLKEISELLSLRIQRITACGDVHKRAVEKIAEIEDKMQGLANMKQTLTKLVKQCKHKKLTDACPILESLDPTMEGGT